MTAGVAPEPSSGRARRALPLGRSEVHVWHRSLAHDDKHEELAGLLSTDERLRAAAETAGAADTNALRTELHRGGERFLHALENGLDGEFRLGFGYPGAVHHFVDDVELNHRRLPAAGSLRSTKWLMLRDIRDIVNGRLSSVLQWDQVLEKQKK